MIHKKKETVKIEDISKDYIQIPLEPFKFTKNEIVFIIILIFIAGVVRFYQLGFRSLWIDEHGTYEDAVKVFRKGFYNRAHFLSFMLVNLSLKFGFSEFTLRLPSCIAGVLVVPAIYVLAKRIFGITEIRINQIENKPEAVMRNDMLADAMHFINVDEKLTQLTTSSFQYSQFSNEKWGILGDPMIVRMYVQKNNILRIEVPFDMNIKCAIITPLIRKVDDKFGYFNASLMTKDLINHSTTLHILFFDDEKKFVAQKIIYPTGLTGTTDWIEMPAIEDIPKQATQYAFSIPIYKNSTAPGKKNGYVFIKDPTFNPYK